MGRIFIVTTWASLCRCPESQLSPMFRMLKIFIEPWRGPGHVRNEKFGKLWGCEFIITITRSHAYGIGIVALGNLGGMQKINVLVWIQEMQSFLKVKIRLGILCPRRLSLTL